MPPPVYSFVDRTPMPRKRLDAMMVGQSFAYYAQVVSDW
jgi:hypothetical protein